MRKFWILFNSSNSRSKRTRNGIFKTICSKSLNFASY